MNGSGIEAARAIEMKQLISFAVGQEDFAVELQQVKEVIRMREITWLPRAPHCVKGVINLRGDVIPVIDLRDRFGLSSIDQTGATRVIIVEVEGRSVGVVVDSTSQVVRAPADQFQLAPAMVGKAARELIVGVGKIGEKLIVLIDVNRLLGAAEMDQISDSLRNAGGEPTQVTGN